MIAGPYDAKGPLCIVLSKSAISRLERAFLERDIVVGQRRIRRIGTEDGWDAHAVFTAAAERMPRRRGAPATSKDDRSPDLGCALGRPFGP